MSYNGWSNYETWAVALWMDNEPGTYGMRCEAMQEAWENAGDHKVWSKPEEARYTLAEWLKDFVEEVTEEELLKEHQGPGKELVSMLIGAALSEVDWSEIADSWLTEVDGYERAA